MGSSELYTLRYESLLWKIHSSCMLPKKLISELGKFQSCFFFNNSESIFLFCAPVPGGRVRWQCLRYPTKCNHNKHNTFKLASSLRRRFLQTKTMKTVESCNLCTMPFIVSSRLSITCKMDNNH